MALFAVAIFRPLGLLSTAYLRKEKTIMANSKQAFMFFVVSSLETVWAIGTSTVAGALLA
jgi:hypothetical protein